MWVFFPSLTHSTLYTVLICSLFSWKSNRKKWNAIKKCTSVSRFTDGSVNKINMKFFFINRFATILNIFTVTMKFISRFLLSPPIQLHPLCQIDNANYWYYRLFLNCFGSVWNGLFSGVKVFIFICALL